MFKPEEHENFTIDFKDGRYVVTNVYSDNEIVFDSKDYEDCLAVVRRLLR